MYSPQLLDHFQNPRNAGTLEPPAVRVRVENPVCGDILELSAIVAEGRIAEIRFQTRGCTASIACGSATAAIFNFVGARYVAFARRPGGPAAQ